jgi:hypothetical protein
MPLVFLAREIAENRALAVLSDKPAGRLGVRDCLEATCAHLAPATAELFALIGVFADAFSHDALVHVAGGRATADLFDDLSCLVDLCLLEQTPDDTGGMHYRMPALVRELASHRLRDSGRYDDAARHHAEYFQQVARRAALLFADGFDERALPIVQGPGGELEAALAWSERHDRLGAVRLAADLATVTGELGGHERCRASLEALVREVGDDLDELTRCDALLAAAAVGLMSKAGAADSETIMERLSEGTVLARAVHEPQLLLRALNLTVSSISATGDVELASLVAHEGIEVSRRLRHGRWQARFEAWSACCCTLPASCHRLLGSVRPRCGGRFGPTTRAARSSLGCCCIRCPSSRASAGASRRP